MPRTARKKDKNRPHHIMSRSIPELNLFTCDEDKEYHRFLMNFKGEILLNENTMGSMIVITSPLISGSTSACVGQPL